MNFLLQKHPPDRSTHLPFSLPSFLLLEPLSVSDRCLNIRSSKDTQDITPSQTDYILTVEKLIEALSDLNDNALKDNISHFYRTVRHVVIMHRYPKKQITKLIPRDFTAISFEPEKGKSDAKIMLYNTDMNDAKNRSNIIRLLMTSVIFILCLIEDEKEITRLLDMADERIKIESP